MGIFDNLLSALGVSSKPPTRIPDFSPKTEEPVPPTIKPVAPPPQPDPLHEQNVPKGIYVPKYGSSDNPNVPHVILNEQEAIAQGWRFKRKSRKRAKLTQYCGTERDIIIPAKIGEYTVNELGRGIFFKAKIDSLSIPYTVKKLRENCVRESTVRRITIAHGVQTLPSAFAFSCSFLHEISLPSSVKYIEDSAFSNCKRLTFFSFPHMFRSLGAHAFKGSGLRDFTLFPSPQFSGDGTAFQETPLEENNRMIAASYSDYNAYNIIAICRSKQETITLPAEKIYLGKHAVPDGWNSRLKRIDCSACKYISFDDDAIQTHFGYFDTGKPYTSNMTVILPKGRTAPAFFHSNITAVYDDGTPWEGIVTKRGESEYQMNLRTLPAYSVRMPDQTVRLLPKSGGWLGFQPKAICTETLESITFGELRGKGMLFHPCCERLHHVQWEQQSFRENASYRELLEVYLPSREQIGFWQHRYLLNAFTGTFIQNNRTFQFFDCRPFDRLFSVQDTRQHHYTNEELTHVINYHKRNWRDQIPRMRQKHKIMLAADVLRSSPVLFPNRAMYAEYLRTHKRYALLICDTLPDEYTAFLLDFYQ